MIRPASDDDIIPIIQIWKSSIETNNTPGDIQRVYRRNKRYWFVYDGKEVGEVIGFSAGSVKSRTRGHISGIAVLEEYRGKGIGKNLFNVAIDAFIKDKFKKVTLEVRPSNKVAVGLYESHGFKRTHIISGYYPDGEDAINYEKIL